MGKITDALFYEKTLDNTPDIVSLKSRLTDHQLLVLQSEQPKYTRSVLLAYLLWWFLWPVGAHKFYVGKPGRGVGYIALFVTAVLTYVVGMPITSSSVSIAPLITSIILLLLLVVCLLVDMFTLPAQVRDVWARAELNIIQRLVAGESE